jgi:hypothetical protein
MTEQPRCERCARPIHDQAYVDDRCGTDLRRALETVARVAGEAATTVARLDVIGEGGRRTDTDAPLPVNLAAAEQHDAAVNTVVTWARHVAEERGAPRWNYGSGHPLALVAMWLCGQLDWLRHRPEASEAFGDLLEACWVIERVVDRPAERWAAGLCGVDGCEEVLRPVSGAKSIRCRCGAEHDLAERKTYLLGLIEDEWVTAAKAAHLLTSLGVVCTAAMVRGYAFRGRLAPYPESDPAQYRLGSVRDLVTEQHAEERERVLRAAVRTAELAERRRKKEAVTA